MTNLISLYTVLIIVSSACNSKSYPGNTGYRSSTSEEKPKYSNVNYWAAHPLKNDMSDSVPQDLRVHISFNRQADVFFVHPTTFTQKDFDSFNASITDEALNNKTDKTAILYQASVFNESCNVYAPRYRQAHYQAFFIDKADAKKYFDLAYHDVKAAFEYYLANYNNGKPIVIAGHSQGTLHAMQLLKDFFDGKPLQQKLVAAYLPGMPVPKDYFASIPACANANQIGCVLSWRTFKTGYKGPKYIQNEEFEAIVTNPLSWDTSETFSSKNLNTGSILRNFNALKPKLVSAQTHQNILWCNKPKFPGSFLLRTKNYHIADYNFYYSNIRNNVAKRLNAYSNLPVVK